MMIKTIGIILLLAAGLLLASFSNIRAEWEVYNEESGHLYSNYLTSIKADDSGNVWIGENNQGLIKFHKSFAWLYYNFFSSGLINDRITDIVKTSSGKTWFATLGGLSAYDGDSVWISYNTDSGLPYIDIKAMAVDNDDNIWLGTFGAGLTFFDRDTTFIHYTTDSGLIDNRILAVHADLADNIWVGTYSGISRFDRISDWRSFDTTNSGLLDDTVRAIVEDGAGNIWFGSANGLSRLSSDSIWINYYEYINCPYNIEHITALAVDSSGNLWLGHDMFTSQGVFVTKFDGISGWTQYDIDNNQMASNVGVVDISVDSVGNVWIATSGEGVTCIKVDPTDVRDLSENVIPEKFSLSQNYPNPFNQATTIEYSLPQKAVVNITIYNILGQKVKDLVKAVKPAGDYRIDWDGSYDNGMTGTSGIYFYRLNANDFEFTRKLILLK